MSDEVAKFMAAHDRAVAAQEALDAADVAKELISDEALNKLFNERNGALWSVIRVKAPTQNELLLKLKWLRRIADDERQIGSPYNDDRTQHLIARIVLDFERLHVSQ